jgi:predicted glycosyltransferase
LFSGKTIFISPIDWGLGHSTRCVPLIRKLSGKNKIIIGTTALNAVFFEQHFPGIQKVSLPSYNIRYSAVLPVWLKVLLQWPKIRRVIGEEKKRLEELLRLHAIDIVISDNRFGLHHNNAHCIFMTHQLQVKAPFLSFAARWQNRRYIQRFHEVWVPDHQEESSRLSGELSSSGKMTIPVNYIGPLSHLQGYATEVNETEKTDYLLLLSGAEPQRSRLEALLLERFAGTNKKVVLVRGSNDPKPLPVGGIRVIDFAAGEDLCRLIVNAETVICRSGYSTLMDLHLLHKKKLVLIPTPGQTEQEYLADYWKKKMYAEVIAQERLSKTHLLPAP